MDCLKKACELAILCGVHIAIIFFTIGGKSHSFGSPSISSVLKKFTKTNEVDEQIDNVITHLANSNKESRQQELNQYYNEISEKLTNERERGKVLEETLKGSFGGKMSGECISGHVKKKLVQLKFHVIELEKICKGKRKSRSVCSSSNDDYKGDLYKMEIPKGYLKL